MTAIKFSWRGQRVEIPTELVLYLVLRVLQHWGF